MDNLLKSGIYFTKYYTLFYNIGFDASVLNNPNPYNGEKYAQNFF